ncbi:hypothetical protein AA313_de0204591 [Arthrobotrys entomopaga]|nr:hypothetical protein AA313_de0204591 [Arthrobotrys entomopaga]
MLVVENDITPGESIITAVGAAQDDFVSPAKSAVLVLPSDEDSRTSTTVEQNTPDIASGDESDSTDISKDTTTSAASEAPSTAASINSSSSVVEETSANSLEITTSTTSSEDSSIVDEDISSETSETAAITTASEDSSSSTTDEDASTEIPDITSSTITSEDSSPEIAKTEDAINDTTDEGSDCSVVSEENSIKDGENTNTSSDTANINTNDKPTNDVVDSTTSNGDTSDSPAIAMDTESPTVAEKENTSESDIKKNEEIVDEAATSTASNDNSNDTTIEENLEEPGADFPWPIPVSKAKADWEYQKTSWSLENDATETLMDMISLERIKAKFVEITSLIAASNRQKKLMKNETQSLNSYKKMRFGAVLIGNPGTGKTTVANLYADFLYQEGIVSNPIVVKATGASIAAGGVQGCEKLLEDIESGGVLLVEDAHHLVSSNVMFSDSATLDHLLSEVDNLTGKAVFIFSGYGKQMEILRGQNPIFSNLIPITMKFPDYEDGDLHLLLLRELKQRFGNKMKVEDGYYGLYMRIVVRRIGKARGSSSFGNARAVQNAVARILKRQANRLFRETKEGKTINDLFITKEDLMGPPPSTVFNKSRAWKQLQKMIGLNSVKEAVKALIHRLQLNYDRELAEKPLVECSLNKLFLGNPGTGKTTVAKLYGQILADIGLLSTGDVILKNPADLIGDALGQSERNTKAILDATKGNVLIIDEAYMLGNGSDDSAVAINSFRSSVVDTIVAEVQSTSYEDRCVLLLGYRDQMESMLNNGNQALARRFPLATAFEFADYSNDELRQILSLKLDEQGFRASEKTMDVAMEVLERSRHRPGFGNAGEVDILLDEAKSRHHRRMLAGGDQLEADIFEPEDIDENFDRINQEPNIRVLFSDFVGCESLIERFEGYQHSARNMKLLGVDPREAIPFTFLFRGPPGTGKTTTARKMGSIFYQMGLLSTEKVMECSATDLIGEYVGHTGPKTKKLFDSALGRVLFIDEAYKLSDGGFGKEAMVEMVNNLTKEKYRNKLVIVLAGYDHEINKLMDVNPGLTSRFPEAINFKHLSPASCVEILFKKIKAKLQKMDTSQLESSEELKRGLEDSFRKLSLFPGWGNARDVETLANAIFLRMMRNPTPPSSLAVPEKFVLEETESMIKERQHQTTSSSGSGSTKRSRDEPLVPDMRPTMPTPPMPTPPKVNINTKVNIKKEESGPSDRITELDDDDEESSQQFSHLENERGPAVTEAVWEQLQKDKRVAEIRKRELKNAPNVLALATGEEAKARAMLSALDPTSAIAERWRQRLAIAEEKRRKLEEELREKQEEEKREKEIQKRIREMGLCYAGYDWVKQDGGYRCSAGVCWLSETSLDQILNK